MIHSEQVAPLLRPVLDELQHYRAEGDGDRRLVDEYFYAVTNKQGHFADEALALGAAMTSMESKQKKSSCTS